LLEGREAQRIMIMKTSFALGTAFALLLGSSVASAAPVLYKATLNGAQETPANASAATGTAMLSFNNNKLTGSVALVGLAVTSAQHIHVGVCGTGGLPTMNSNLVGPVGGIITVNVTLTTAEATALATGGLYVNVHSTAFPNGEIRGQIYQDASTAVCPLPSDGGAPDAGGDAGDAGSSGTSGTPGTSGTSGTPGTSGTSGTSGGSNGAMTVADDAGDGAAPAGDGGGCSTTGTDSNGGSLAMMGLAGLGLVLVARSRKKR
jgi:MYXO-CTERM domain-containing protein